MLAGFAASSGGASTDDRAGEGGRVAGQAGAAGADGRGSGAVAGDGDRVGDVDAVGQEDSDVAGTGAAVAEGDRPRAEGGVGVADERSLSNRDAADEAAAAVQGQCSRAGLDEGESSGGVGDRARERRVGSQGADHKGRGAADGVADLAGGAGERAEGDGDAGSVEAQVIA